MKILLDSTSSNRFLKLILTFNLIEIQDIHFCKNERKLLEQKIIESCICDDTKERDIIFSSHGSK